MIQLAKRARRKQTPVANIRTWQTADKRWAVDEIKSRYRLPTRYLVVERLANGNERIVSRHRKRRAAERALCRMAAKSQRATDRHD